MNKILCLIASISIFLLSFSSLYIESSDYQYQTYVRINPITKEEEIVDARVFEEDEDTTLQQMAMDYFAAYGVNNEVVGWLNIPNIGYYPVTMNEDNQFYLTHNERKENSIAGVPFMNNACGGSFEDIALIHGHHMKNGSMFGSLSKYKDSEFFKNNGLITVFDGEYLYYYKPFTVFLYEDGTDAIRLNKMEEDERLEYINSLRKKSIVTTDEELDLSKQVLFLSTCAYSFENARLTVGSVMVDKVPYNG